MKKIGLLFSLILVVVFSYAQPKIEFEQTVHDFGTIKEEGGKVTAKFTFTNTGNADLLLQSVAPSCGCTAADYTKTAVKPGEKGFINATYDPYGRPGAFYKNIRIRTNEPEYNDPAKQPFNIYIKGEVTKKAPSPYEVYDYKAGKGELRFKPQSVKFEVKNTEFHLDTFKVRNFSENQNMTIEYKNALPYVTESYRSFGKELKPGEEGFIVLKYDPAKRKAWGNIVDKIILTTNDVVETEKTIFYSVNIVEDFSKMTPADLKKAPVIVVDSFTVNFGKVRRGETITKEFTITNKGKSPLAIRSLSPSTGAITCKMDQETIASGKSAKLTVIYNTKDRRPEVISSTIDVFSNDPKNSTVVLRIDGEILP